MSHSDSFRSVILQRTLRLPTSLPISGLARIGVKPRHYRSFWRAFAFTDLLMLPPTSPREVLFACPSSPLCNVPFFTVEFTLCFPCSHSGLAKVLLSLTLLTTTSRSGDLNILLCCFIFGKSGSGILAKCSLCATEATFSVSAGPVCSSFSPKAYVILQSMHWSPVSFLLPSYSQSVLATLFPPVVVITPPLPWDGYMARTAIQVHTVNLIEIWLGERSQPISNQS